MSFLAKESHSRECAACSRMIKTGELIAYMNHGDPWEYVHIKPCPPKQEKGKR